MQINIPDHASQYLARKATDAGFATPEEYLLTLIEQDQSATAYAESLTSDERLERLALEGLESGEAGPMTKQDWADVRRQVAARIEKRDA